MDVGWVTNVGIIGPDAMTKMFIDYEQYPIRCRLYLGLKHIIKDCASFKGCKVPHRTMALDS